MIQPGLTTFITHDDKPIAIVSPRALAIRAAAAINHGDHNQADSCLRLAEFIKDVTGDIDTALGVQLDSAETAGLRARYKAAQFAP